MLQKSCQLHPSNAGNSHKNVATRDVLSLEEIVCETPGEVPHSSVLCFRHQPIFRQSIWPYFTDSFLETSSRPPIALGLFFKPCFWWKKKPMWCFHKSFGCQLGLVSIANPQCYWRKPSTVIHLLLPFGIFIWNKCWLGILVCCLWKVILVCTIVPTPCCWWLSM